MILTGCSALNNFNWFNVLADIGTILLEFLLFNCPMPVFELSINFNCLFLVDNLNSMSKYQFVLEDNHKLQRVISSIFASSVVEGMLMSNDKDMETKIYEFNFETIIEYLIFYDLYQQKYKLLSVVVDVLGEPMLKEIVLNYSKFLEKTMTNTLT